MKLIRLTGEEVPVYPEDALQVLSFKKDEYGSLDKNENKGFPLRCGVAEQAGKKFFMKFALLGDEKCSAKTAEDAFLTELKFQMRYPYIVYVDSLSRFGVIAEEADQEKPEFCEFIQLMKTARVRLHNQGKLSGQPDETEERFQGTIICLLEDFAEGEELSVIYHYSSEQVPEKTMFRHMYQLIDGMNAYYSRLKLDNLLHRDIKPANIMVSKDLKQIRYIDFDLAHINGSRKTGNRGSFIDGTPGYAHPRQTSLGAGKSNIRLDIYELGMTFLYMLIGEDYIQAAFHFPDMEISNYSYISTLEEKSIRDGIPYLYEIQRDRLKRNGKNVFQEEKYSGLLDIIDRMIADDGNLAAAVYKNPRALAEDFVKFLKNFYGDEYQEIIADDVVLSACTGKTVNSEPLDSRISSVRIQFLKKHGDSVLMNLNQQQIVSISDGQEIGVISLIHGKARFHFVTADMIVEEGMPMPVNDEIILTREAFKFKISDSEYRLRVISER